jgi:hypothetical protein
LYVPSECLFVEFSRSLWIVRRYFEVYYAIHGFEIRDQK